MGLPSYQHFRPSLRRWAHQCRCGSDGIAALHCCFVCAFGIPTAKSVPKQAAKAIDGNCFLICPTQRPVVAAIGLQRLPNRGVRELPPTCRGWAHCYGAEAEGILPIGVALRSSHEEPIVDQSLLLLIKQIAAGEKKKEKSSHPSDNIPVLFEISHQFLFQ